MRLDLQRAGDPAHSKGHCSLKVKLTIGTIRSIDNILPLSNADTFFLVVTLIAIAFVQDHSSSGNTGSSSDEEWETTSDVSTDQEPFMENGGQPLDRNILDDIARRSVAALRNNDTDDAEEPVEESDARNEANAGLAEEARESQNSAEGDESVNPTVSSQGSNQSADVKTRPTENAGDNTEGLCMFFHFMLVLHHFV